MKILITGVAGFIGSHLADKLIKEGHSVSGLDNLSTGSLNNIKQLFENPNFEFHKESILNKKIIDDLVSNENSMLSLAKTVIAQTKSKSQIKFIPYIDMFGNGFEDMMRRKPNIDKMNEYFDWRPTVSLENSINQIIKFFKT